MDGASIIGSRVMAHGGVRDIHIAVAVPSGVQRKGSPRCTCSLSYMCMTESCRGKDSHNHMLVHAQQLMQGLRRLPFAMLNSFLDLRQQLQGTDFTACKR